ncbi:MAG: altronate dehydratase [Herpetosiphonaceae bacterium]|nr:altronate dehydratase [Herpetosiphonaceae bacterium]
MTTQSISFFEASAPVSVPLETVAVRLHKVDDVAIVKDTLMKGTTLLLAGNDGPQQITANSLIPSGHKIALRAVAEGEAVRRYGQVIGFASRAIAPGEHVHTHNLNAQYFSRDYEYGVDARPIDYAPPAERRTFLGYRRPSGKVGTRNYIAVISTVNCSAHTAREIAHAFTPERLASYPNVDGVIAIAHQAGCANQIGGEDYVLLQRTLAGMAAHPNVGGYILVGLGCEANQISALVENYGLMDDSEAERHDPISLVIQEEGGIRKTIRAGITAVEQLLPVVNTTARTAEPVSELMVALQCGGSDGWSGVTANPVLGMVVDEIVRQGGTAVLAETPEIYGAEHLLIRRATSRDVGDKLVGQIHWWEEHTRLHGIEIDNNPSPGNKAGGLTTIYEKSLGAVAKGGTMPLAGVYDYAEPVTARGFTFMDTPGYDPVATTGQVAGGCNLVVFTTGRGSCFGFKPAPSIKVCTNTRTYDQMTEDMDLNAGQVLEGLPMEQVAAELLDIVIAVASGQPSKSEEQGVGEAEFIPWNLGGTL